MLRWMIISAFATLSLVPANSQTIAPKPTIVLVHGAFADSSSWDTVAGDLKAKGYRVIAAANMLRSVAADAAMVAALTKSLTGPVVLVGHSYGGAVITAAARSNREVTALVYVAAFAPASGETCLGLSAKYPGSTLCAALQAPVDDGSGGKDLYIDPAKFGEQFAADLPRDRSTLMAIAQRPVSQSALTEPAGEPAWLRLPTYWIYGSADRNIPPAAMDFMARRSHSRRTVVLQGASHVVMISHPHEVSALIIRAASAS